MITKTIQIHSSNWPNHKNILKKLSFPTRGPRGDSFLQSFKIHAWGNYCLIHRSRSIVRSDFVLASVLLLMKYRVYFSYSTLVRIRRNIESAASLIYTSLKQVFLLFKPCINRNPIPGRIVTTRSKLCMIVVIQDYRIGIRLGYGGRRSSLCSTVSSANTLPSSILQVVRPVCLVYIM